MTDHPCLICNRPQEDPLHDDAPRGGLAREVTPRIEQHAYDPGERRRFIRRHADRTRAVQEAFHRVMDTPPERRRTDRRD